MMNRYFLLSGILFALLLPATGQDSIVAENVYIHKIKNGKATREKKVLHQTTFDKNCERVLLLIKYDTSVSVTSITHYFYDDTLLISEEEYTGKNDVSKVTRYSYNDKGLMIARAVYMPENNMMKLIKTTTYDYSNGILTAEKVKDRSGKTIGKTSYTFLPDQQIRDSRFRKVSGKEDLKTQTITSFLSGGKIVSEKTVREYYNGAMDITAVKYTRDGKDRLVLEEYYNELEEFVKKVKYTWHKTDGYPTAKATLDPEDNALHWITFARKEFVVDLGDKQMTDLDKPIGSK